MVRKRRDVEHAQREHDQFIDPDKPTREVERYVKARASDQSRWYAATEFLEKYAAAITTIAAVLSVLGFTVITPKRTSAEITARIDSVNIAASRERNRMQMQIDSLRLGKEQLEMSINELRTEIAVLIRNACADRFTPRHDKQISGLLDARGDCIR